MRRDPWGAGLGQATFDWLRGDPSPARVRGTKLPVDGYWPDLRLILEFPPVGALGECIECAAVFAHRDTDRAVRHTETDVGKTDVRNW